MADWHLSLVLLLLGLGGLLSAWLQRPEEAADPPRSASRAAPRLLKPRTPDDCPACRQLPASVPVDRPARAAVRPWGKVKSRRGAPKRIATQGFACANPSCVYWGVIDAAVHALVGDGCHGQRERIQTFRCQACGATLSARRYTALYRLKTISGRVAEVLAALAEGLDVSAAARVFGHQEATITRWLQEAPAGGPPR